MNDATLTPTKPEVQPAEVKTTEETLPPKPSTAIKRQIRIDDEKTFGSITGSDFRVW
jgi:hypothetical protein